MENKMPQNVLKLLWDVDISKLSLVDHHRFIIERILEFGDLAEIRWMEKNFTQDQINKTLQNSRNLTAKSANFFALIYKQNIKDIKCLQTPYTEKQNRFGI